jgi:hypothetical protein
MTGGGLLALVTYGTQNVLLSGNPQMTYFYKVFRRYSHFSMENVTKQLEGPSELQYDQQISLRLKIDRVGDLVSEIYFTFSIPDIYSKYITPTGSCNQQYEFQWVRYLGAAIINNVGFYVGGQKIQEFDGTYIMSRALLDYDKDKFQKWKNLVGDTANLNDPTNGLYAGGLLNQGYPTVIPDPTRSTQAQVNRPSIFGRDITVPLPFWFSEATSQSLPLTALQYHECEVRMNLNSIEQLFNTLDASGFRVAPGYRVLSSTENNNTNIPTYALTNDISTQIKNFLVDIGYTTPVFNTWPLNPRLQTTYIYLTDEDRRAFSSSPLSYIFQEVRMFPFEGLYNRQLLDVECHNPITRLIFITRRSDTTYRNDFANLTNWYNYPKPPFNPTPNINAYLQNSASSGLLIPQGQIDMIRSIRVLVEGNEIQQEKPVDFFSRLTSYRYLTGDSEDFIPVYTFSLHSPTSQPCGSINASRIRNFQVDVDVYPLPLNTTYTYNLYIYAESINFFEVASGMGNRKYAL